MRLIFLFLVGMFLVSFVGAVIPDDCDYSMEAYWKFDGDATDSSGNNHDGSGWPGGVYVLKDGNAANFDGGDKIIIPDIGNFFQGGFAVEMWVQKNGTPATDSVLFKKGDYLIEYLVNRTIRVSVDGVNVNSGVLELGVPYYVALVWEPVSRALVLYIDGSSVGSVMLSSPSVYVGNVEIGGGFVGLMDEVAVYSRAFNEEEVELHYVLSDINKNYCDASGVGGLSMTKADFNIAGCSLPTGGGLAVDTCSRREIDGEYFCDNDAYLWETRELGYGCSLGLTSYTLGDPFCCPAGMFCNETSGVFRCDYRLEQCYNQTNEADCMAIGCVWLSEEGICADGTRDYSCSLYDNSAECLSDVWRLGKTGIGTEFCGSYVDCGDTSYTIPYDSCGCRWDADSGICELYMEASETYYDNSTAKKWFSCSKDYNISECVEGEQDVSWTSTSIVYNGFPAICLDVMGCSDGTSTRMCGEPIVRLPGFGLFALFASVIIIGLYYVFRDRLEIRF